MGSFLLVGVAARDRGVAVQDRGIAAQNRGIATRDGGVGAGNMRVMAQDRTLRVRWGWGVVEDGNLWRPSAGAGAGGRGGLGARAL